MTENTIVQSPPLEKPDYQTVVEKLVAAASTPLELKTKPEIDEIGSVLSKKNSSSEVRVVAPEEPKQKSETSGINLIVEQNPEETPGYKAAETHTEIVKGFESAIEEAKVLGNLKQSLTEELIQRIRDALKARHDPETQERISKLTLSEIVDIAADNTDLYKELKVEWFGVTSDQLVKQSTQEGKLDISQLREAAKVKLKQFLPEFDPEKSTERELRLRKALVQEIAPEFKLAIETRLMQESSLQ